MIPHMDTATFAAIPMDRAPRDLQGWMAQFDVTLLPVLADTAVTIEEMRANEDGVDAHMLAQTIALDPLMSVKVLSLVGRLRRGREGTEPETVTSALVMLGITPFFKLFGPQTTVEDCLAGDERALEGFNSVLRRIHRAANFAIGFAVQRLDHDAAVIHGATLLHDFAELLLWWRAPILAKEIARRQREDSTLRSADIQRQLLHVTLAELQHALMVRWQLPVILARITDDGQHNDSAQVRNVGLAVRLARHTAEGWDSAALADDVREIAELLHLGPEPTLELLRDIDA